MMKTGVFLRAAIFTRKVTRKEELISKLRSLPPTAGVFQAPFCPSTRLRINMENRWNIETAIPIHDPFGIRLTRIRRFPGVYLEPSDSSLSKDYDIILMNCNLYVACRSFQCSCSKAELCSTEVCWCGSDMKCVIPSTISARAMDFD